MIFKRRKIAMIMLIVLCFNILVNMDVEAKESVYNESIIKDELVSSFRGDGFKIISKVIKKEKLSYRERIIIENETNKKIDNWYLMFYQENEILDVKNAEIVSNDENIYVVKNKKTNQDIKPKGKISFEISFKYDGKINLSRSYCMLQKKEILDKSNYKLLINYSKHSNNYSKVSIEIKNISGKRIEDWSLCINYNKKIYNLCNEKIDICKTSYGYQIIGDESKQNLDLNETTIINFLVNKNFENIKNSNIQLYSTGINNIESDIDNDNIENKYELMIGTNPYYKDSDNDGLDDYFELKNGLDACSQDSDNDNINDVFEDEDNDGLNVKEEYIIKTNIKSQDSDNDGLCDGDEINKYFTNPLMKDTDNDGVYDGDEIVLKLNPLEKDTDNDGVVDKNEKIEQNLKLEINNTEKNEVTNVSIEINATGNVNNNTVIENVYKKDTLSSEVVGLVGVPVKISSTASFDEATIKFQYDDTKLENINEEDLAIVWFDEENNFYHIYDEESIVDKENNIVSLKTKHFSTYLLIDSKKWYNVWEKEYIYNRKTEDNDNTANYFDISYVIDHSGSMQGTRITTAINATEIFIDAMVSNDRGNVIGFNSVATEYINFTSNKADLKEAINQLDASGGTNVNGGLLLALEKFNNNNNNNKIIILLCDGDVNCTSETLQKLIDKDIKVYSVLVGSTSAEKILKNISEQTGGEFYYAATTLELTNAISRVQEETLGKLDTTDTDGDGLYDVYEKEGMPIANGQIVYTDPNNSDTDGDGLSDLEEMGSMNSFLDENIIKRYSILVSEKSKLYAQYFDFSSNPMKKDTDNDTVMDNEDPLKLQKGISELMKSSNKNELITELDEQIKEDFPLIMEYKNVGYYSTEECVNILYEYDNLITDISNEYLFPKQMIQSILLRELRCYDMRDDIVDALVESQFTYCELVEEYNNSSVFYKMFMGYPTKPIPYREDCSTGYAQIFAKTAIQAINSLVEKDVVEDRTYDFENWKDRKEVWVALKNEPKYNIKMISYILMKHALTDFHYSRKFWNYDETMIECLFARYNGENADAKEYGKQVYKLYEILYNYK